MSEKSNDKVTINIIKIKNCINKSEKNDLNQLLKNQLEEFKDILRNAKGDSKINTFTIIKRKEYENIKERRPMLQKDLIIPFKEKTSNEVPPIERMEFNSPTNVLKEICLEIISFPTSCIAVVIRSVMLINCSQIKYELFIIMALKTILNIN